MGTPLRSLKLKILEETTSSALETTVQRWMQAGSHKELVSVDFRVGSSSLFAFIVYTE